MRLIVNMSAEMSFLVGNWLPGSGRGLNVERGAGCLREEERQGLVW